LKIQQFCAEIKKEGLLDEFEDSKIDNTLIYEIQKV